MPQNLTDPQWQEIESHVYAGRKIQAIKLFREFVRVDLKAAKDAVDEYEAKLRKEFPEKFTATSKKGCGTAVLLLASTLLILTLLITLKLKLE